jgi:hypothetical protein
VKISQHIPAEPQQDTENLDHDIVSRLRFESGTSKHEYAHSTAIIVLVAGESSQPYKDKFMMRTG